MKNINDQGYTNYTVLIVDDASKDTIWKKSMEN